VHRLPAAYYAAEKRFRTQDEGDGKEGEWEAGGLT